MNNRKVDMDRLSRISKVSNGKMEANTAWTIPVTEFTFTFVATAIAVATITRKRNITSRIWYITRPEVYPYIQL
ncbi:hypothetical protein [Levilactobacillus cerevisiae]|uniref:hypothetical protein n=1 Tax=Levilactobacillus cerevisiae TaxID=1704076 RepID=UPI000F7A4048|nr:hypothetical protein [Levilactobacillus cerevisiae]